MSECLVGELDVHAVVLTTTDVLALNFPVPTEADPAFTVPEVFWS